MSEFFYVTDRPVADQPSFLGRDVLLKSLGEAITRNRIFMVVGAAKMGRTSVLQKLVDKANEALRQPLVSAKQVLVHVDLQPLRGGNPNQLVMLLWNALQKAVLDPHVQNHADPPRPSKLELLRTSNPFEVLQAATDALWEKLANTPGWCRYGLLLDNAEVLAAPSWHNPLTDLVKFVSATRAGSPQALGLAGSLGLRTLLAPHKKVLRAARLHVLEPLRIADAQALGKLGGLPTAVSDTAFDAFGGHPFFLQHAMAALQANPESDPANVCAQVGESLVGAFFDMLIEDLPPPARGTGISPERSLLVWLFEQGGEGDAARAEAALNLGPLRAACDSLVGCGIMERSVRGGSGTWLRLNGSVFNTWLKDKLNL